MKQKNCNSKSYKLKSTPYITHTTSFRWSMLVLHFFQHWVW